MERTSFIPMPSQRTGEQEPSLPRLDPHSDEFFGNLYHLNAEEELELRDYPPGSDFPNFRKNFGPLGVLHCWAEILHTRASSLR